MGMVSYIPAIIISVLLHAVVIALVFIGWQASPPKKIEQPAFIKATLVDLKTEGKKAAPKSKAKPKPIPKKINLEKKHKEAAKKKAAEKKRKQALAKKKAAEKAKAKAKQEKLKQQKLAKEKALAKKRAQEKAKKQEQAKKEKQRLQEQAKAEQQELEKQRLQENLQRERARLDAERKAELAAVQLEADKKASQSYISVIQRRINDNWSRPPSARNGMKVELRIQLVPTGTVVNVAVIKSSGSDAFDRSAINAVNKVGQFSEIKSMPSRIFEREFRQFILLFQPQDLRQ